jgi:hypothetical protein
MGQAHSLNSLNDVNGFSAAYVSELINDDDLDLLNTPAVNIEPCLMMLAAGKVGVELLTDTPGHLHE